VLWCITPILRVSRYKKNSIFVAYNLKHIIMLRKKADLSNSIYQQEGSGYGLTQKDGMLINNRPDGITGIQQLAQLKKSVRRAEKISTYSEAIMLGNRMEDMGESCD